MSSVTVEYDESNILFMKILDLMKTMGAVVKQNSSGQVEYVPTAFEAECIELGRKEHEEGKYAFRGSVDDLRKQLGL